MRFERLTFRLIASAIVPLDKGTLLVEPYAAGLIADDEDERPQNEKKKPKKS